jgi:hypothetical protein
VRENFEQIKNINLSAKSMAKEGLNQFFGSNPLNLPHTLMDIDDIKNGIYSISI